MKPWLILAIVILGSLITAVVIGNQELTTIAARDDGPGAAQPGGKRTPVIVELFTSEGCSSCPPADDVLAKLERTQPVEGAEIIALGEHVDYWNYIGWSDPFSSPVFGERQGVYAEAFGRDGNYTPQMVVDGRAEFVGSNWNKAVAAIANAAGAPKAEVRITPIRKTTGAVELQVRAGNPPTAASGDIIDLMLAVTESDLSSNVSRGENAGRRLNHRTVVRQLSLIQSAEAKPGAAFSSETAVTLAKGWKPENLRAVAFLQERKSRRVVGAAAVRLMDE
jgi:hypothetical protein